MVDTAILELLGESIALVAVSGLLIEVVSRLIRTIVHRAGGRPATLRGIRDWLRVVWVAIAISGIVSIWGIASQLTVLTISGIAGLVISLSLQAVFSNMISGILLLSDGAVGVGDRIEYGGVKGEVIRVALRNTWIRTDAGPIAIVGNSALAGGPLINHTAAARMDAALRATEPR